MLGAANPPDRSLDLPSNSVLLLVAPWCAPCWSELGRIDALASAAAPLTVRVLAMEDGARARAMTADLPPGRQWLPAPDARARVRAGLWAMTPGLPFSVATDRAGKICADHGGGLTDAQARILAKRCGAAQ